MRNIHYITSKRGANAQGIIQDDGSFLVLRGSKIAPTIAISCGESAKNKRLYLNSEGIIVNFEFTCDYLFNSPREAAQVIVGWKSEDNISSKEELDENKYIFSIESHLENFIINNWKLLELSQKYDIYSENDEIVGQQYPTEVGIIDILATSKDKKEILVIELKCDKSNDKVVGQIQRYMGFVKAKMTTKDQIVRGMIITLESDKKLQYALSMTNNIELYKYNINFSLDKL